MGKRKMGIKICFLGEGGTNDCAWFLEIMVVYAKTSCAFGTPIAELSRPPMQDSVEPLEKRLYPEMFTIFLRILLRLNKMK